MAAGVADESPTPAAALPRPAHWLTHPPAAFVAFLDNLLAVRADATYLVRPHWWGEEPVTTLAAVSINAGRCAGILLATQPTEDGLVEVASHPSPDLTMLFAGWQPLTTAAGVCGYSTGWQATGILDLHDWAVHNAAHLVEDAPPTRPGRSWVRATQQLCLCTLELLHLAGEDVREERRLIAMTHPQLAAALTEMDDLTQLDDHQRSPVTPPRMS